MKYDNFGDQGEEMRGLIKEWWGNLTNEELEQAGSKAKHLVTLLQQKYGYSQARAEQEFNRLFEEVKESNK